MKRVFQGTLTIALILLAGVSLPSAQTALLPSPTEGPVVLADAGTTTDAEPAGQPDIKIPDPLFTFEPVVDGTEVVHDFQVYNRGSGPLAIEKVQTG